jgi:hypothetical protein
LHDRKNAIFEFVIGVTCDSCASETGVATTVYLIFRCVEKLCLENQRRYEQNRRNVTTLVSIVNVGICEGNARKLSIIDGTLNLSVNDDLSIVLVALYNLETR